MTPFLALLIVSLLLLVAVAPAPVEAQGRGRGGGSGESEDDDDEPERGNLRIETRDQTGSKVKGATCVLYNEGWTNQEQDKDSKNRARCDWKNVVEATYKVEFYVDNDDGFGTEFWGWGIYDELETYTWTRNAPYATSATLDLASARPGTAVTMTATVHHPGDDHHSGRSVRIVCSLWDGDVEVTSASSIAVTIDKGATVPMACPMVMPIGDAGSSYTVSYKVVTAYSGLATTDSSRDAGAVAVAASDGTLAVSLTDENDQAPDATLCRLYDASWNRIGDDQRPLAGNTCTWVGLGDTTHHVELLRDRADGNPEFWSAATYAFLGSFDETRETPYATSVSPEGTPTQGEAHHTDVVITNPYVTSLTVHIECLHLVDGNEVAFTTTDEVLVASGATATLRCSHTPGAEHAGGALRLQAGIVGQFPSVALTDHESMELGTVA